MIISNYEKLRIKKLEEKSIVCETLYYNVNQKNSPIYIRSTDGKIFDNIFNYAIKEKRYFINDVCIYVEKKFNPHILYKINSYNDGDEIINCPNCGNTGKSKELIDGCPYCRTNFNFGINNINISKREKLERFTSKFYWITYFTIIIILFAIMILFLGLNIIYWLFLCYFICICMFVIQIIKLFIKKYKNPNYQILSNRDLKNVWKISKDENSFYNDFNKCINIYMYNKENLIDFDILENKALEFISENNVIIHVLIREVYYNGEITKKTRNLKISMKYIDGKKFDGRYSVITCPNCGATIDVADSMCKYCKSNINYNINWYIDDLTDS